MIAEMKEPQNASRLFEGWQETMIWSCLQRVMGKIYADDPKNPSSAMAILGDFIFFAGEPCKELVLYKPDWCARTFIIMVPQDERWSALIEKCYGKKSKRVERYAMKKEPDVFRPDELQAIIASLPPKYSMQMMDEALYARCRQEYWCRDFVAQYADYGTYRKLGIGAVILKDGEPVSGASSYSSYQDGIEIEIGTKQAYRRQGLATICGAKLILECLNRKLYPSWDAQNKWSVALAQKLGYHFDHPYTAYEIQDY